MAGEFKGLTVKFRGDDSGLTAALHKIGSEASKARGNARDFQKALRFDPGNLGALRGQIGETSRQFVLAKERVNVLEQALEQMDAAADPDGFRKWSARLEAARADAERLHMQLLDLKADYDVQNSLVGKFATGLQDLGGAMQSAGERMAGVGDTLTTHVTAPLMAAATYSMKAGIDVDTALTGVRKTVDATAEEYEALRDAALEYSKTNAVTAVDTLNAEELAGQLGVAKENLEQFAHVATGLDISTNMNVEQASTNLARFANLTNMGKLEGEAASAAYEAYGNVIVGLGNNLATTESEISDFSLRMASAGTQAGMSEPEIMGIAGAMSSLGLEAQAGGSAFSKTISDISVQVATGGEDLEKYAAVAGTTADEFAAKWRDDAASAFVDFINGLANGGEDINVVLQDLGINELRQSDAMRRLAGNTDLVTNAMELANEQWERGTALSDEVANKNDSQAAKWQMVENRITAVAAELGGPLSEAALDAIDAAEPLIRGVEDLARAFTDMSKEEQTARIQQVAMVAAAGPILSVAGRGVDAIGKVTTGFGKAIEFGTRFVSAAKNGGSAIEALSTAAGMGAEGVATLSGALGAIGTAAGIGLAAAAIATIKKESDEAAQRERDLSDATRLLGDATSKASPKVRDVSGSMEELGEKAHATYVNVKDVTEAQAEMARSFAESNRETQGHIDKLQAAKQAIESYTDQQGLTAEEQGKLIAAVQTLNSECGTQYEVVDAANGVIRQQGDDAKVTADELSKLIEKQQEQVRVEALTEQLGKVYKQKADAMAAVASATKTVQDREAEYQEKLKEYNQMQDDSTGAKRKAREELDAYAKYVDRAKEAQKEANADYDAAVKAEKSLSEQIGATSAAMEGSAKTVQDYALASSAVTTALETNGQSVDQFAASLEEAGMSVDTFKSLSEDQLLQLASSYDGTLSSIEGLLSEWADTAQEEGERGAAGVTEAVEKETPNTKAAAKRQSDAAAKSGVFDAAKAARKNTRDMAKAMAAQKPAVASSAKTLLNAALKMSPGDMSGKGRSSGNSFASGIASAAGRVSSSASSLASSASNMKNVGNTYQWGSDAGSNFASGIRAAESAVRKAASAVAAAAKAALGHSVPKEGPLHEGGRGEVVYGEHLVDNFAQGMRNRIPELRRTSSQVALAASMGLSADYGQKMSVGLTDVDMQTRAITGWLDSHLGVEANGGNVYVTLQYDAASDANDMARDVTRIIAERNSRGGY